LILLLFGWVLTQLLVKAWQVRREHAATAMFQLQLAVGESEHYRPSAFNLQVARATRRDDLITECSRSDPSSLHEAVPAAAGLDSGMVAGSYGPLHVYAWILPVLGFIGTASGMASSIDGFKNALGGQGQIEDLSHQLAQTVIPGLSAAFETTILALAASVVTYLCTSALRSWDQDALNELDGLCILLLSRIPEPEGPDSKKIVARLEYISPTPYNTYVIDGLPPGPIANPGRAAIEAVANPAPTKELYFAADGTGGHAFSETLTSIRKTSRGCAKSSRAGATPRRQHGPCVKTPVMSPWTQLAGMIQARIGAARNLLTQGNRSG
jgi:biopolymer transport protein ExbB/TolQ